MALLLPLSYNSEQKLWNLEGMWLLQMWEDGKKSVFVICKEHNNSTQNPLNTLFGSFLARKKTKPPT